MAAGVMCLLSPLLWALSLGIHCSSARASVLTTCLYNGVTYQSGESFKPAPCQFCHCDPTSGQVRCAIGDCVAPNCVDAVSGPDQCCPVCPNGPNCMASDGTVIKEGEKLTISTGIECECPPGFHYGQQSAVCTSTPTIAGIELVEK